jgi:hypothetical protein
MAWEKRGNAKYFYLSRRDGGRVKKVYLGRKPTALLAARFEAEERRRLAADTAALGAERARLRPAQEAADALDSAARLLSEAALLAAGYRRHGHGSWRRARP